MWNTPEGKRVLTSTERSVVCDAAYSLVDVIRAAKLEDEAASLGILLFDRLAWSEQLAMLLKVLRPLLDPRFPAPTRTALQDATVAAIYAQMLDNIQIEIEMQQQTQKSEEGDTEFRQLVAAALRECAPENNWPDPECVVMQLWELAVETLQGLVLADEDWNFGDLTMDASPDRATSMKKLLGINDAYFTDIPPDVTRRNASAVWADIIELISGERPDESVFS